MKGLLRSAAAGAVLFALASPAAAARPAWPQRHSDLRADPAIRFGTLPNGMRYALMRNATPAGSTSLRLRIDAGSLDESDDERGIAHFVEHMVLDGTRHVPAGEFVKILEREGLRFGPDTNANTGFDQTVFQLDLPQTDATKIGTALFLLREVVDQAVFDPQALDRERGVVLAEERSRATPDFRIRADELAFLLRGDLLPERMPIGSTAIIRAAGRDKLLAFYRRYYRPERATLIAVGDFDPAALEAQLERRFADWRGGPEAGADPRPSALAPRPIEAHVRVEPGAATRVWLTWVRPPDLRRDDAALRREQIVDRIGLQILQRRLERASATTRPGAYLQVGAGRRDEARRAELVQVDAVSAPGKWPNALTAIEQEQRRFVEHGITKPELDREIAVERAQYSEAVTGADTRSSPAVAQGLVGAVDRNEVFVSPADSLALFEQAVKGLAPEQVDARMRILFAGVPLIGLTSPAAVDGGETALGRVYDQAHQVAVAAPPVQQAEAWPYQSFGSPGAVASRTDVADLGISEIRFANGVRLDVKPTDFRKGQILVAIRYGAGTREVPTDRISPTWGLAAFTDGGLGRLSLEDMKQTLAGTVYSARSAEDEDAFVLGGRTRPADFARQMQILAAYVTDPGWRSSGWNRLRGLSAAIHGEYEATPNGVFRRDAPSLLRSGDKRWAVPSAGEMASSSIAAERAVLAPALADGPLEVDIVGDISVDEAIRQTAVTFGALPQRHSAAPADAAGTIRFPAPAIEVRTHRGRADQGLGFVAWPTQDFYSDTRRTRILNLLAQLIQLRLIDEFRTKQGATYSPSAGHAPSLGFPGYGYLSASIEAPPERLDAFFADVARIAQDLRDRLVGADELERARRPVIDNLIRRRAGNDYWIDEIAGIQDRAERLDGVRSALPQYRSISAAELQQAARLYLADDKEWKLKIVPETAQTAAAAAPAATAQ